MTTSLAPSPGQEIEQAGIVDAVRTVRLVLVESRPLMQHAYREILGIDSAVEITGVATTMHEVEERLSTIDADVVVVDSDGSGIAADDAGSLARRVGGGIVLIGRRSQSFVVRRALEAGVSAYLCGATVSVEDLLQAIHAVADGETWVDPGFGAALATPSASDELTDRELEVVRLLTLGYRNAEVARRIHVSVRTVESHRAHAMAKLRFDHRWELVRWSLEMGLV